MLAQHMFGDKELPVVFKDRFHAMTQAEIIKAYETIQPKIRETDLTGRCVEKIVADVVGNSVLDLGCGSGYLADRLAAVSVVTAADFIVSQTIADSKPYEMLSVDLERPFPFADGEFETVTCTHTLEHIGDIRGTISEIRRVARSRAIIVVPLQRPYQYTVDLHVQFFPYPWSFLNVARPAFCSKVADFRYSIVNGDLYYVEDYLPAE